MSSPPPLSISIHAMGGQGGGVLAGWLAEIAGQCGWLAQTTSVPGVAQRTGATVYYVELFPKPAPGQPEPVLALMPSPGHVDLVVASELMEAGRAINRGLVTPDVTTLVMSTHRQYAISEKSGMGDDRLPDRPVLDAAQDAARVVVAGDMAAAAQANHCLISAPLLGAIAASGALPFPRDAYEEAIRASGIAAKANLAGFAAGFEGVNLSEVKAAPALEDALQTLLELGERRLLDYQDQAYAALYRQRVQSVADLDGGDQALSREVARGLALWMSFEDAIRVADLKIRAERFARVREEARARPDQILHIYEFLHPRVEEVCDLLPKAIGAWALSTGWARAWLERLFAKGRQVPTSKLRGFLLLSALAGLRPWRRNSLRYALETEKIEAWLTKIRDLAKRDPALALELARCQQLIKGYGDTYARGWRNYSTLFALIDQVDSAALAELRQAALADDQGRALAQALQQRQLIQSAA